MNPHSLSLLRQEKGRGKKLLMKYDGPFEIAQKVSPVAYRLRLPASYGIHPVINIAHLETYEPSTEDLGERPTKHLNRADFEESGEFGVNAILGDRLERSRGGKRKIRTYKVRFTGYGPEADEWLPYQSIRNAREALNDYQNRKAAHKAHHATTSLEKDHFEFNTLEDDQIL